MTEQKQRISRSRQKFVGDDLAIGCLYEEVNVLWFGLAPIFGNLAIGVTFNRFDKLPPLRFVGKVVERKLLANAVALVDADPFRVGVRRLLLPLSHHGLPQIGAGGERTEVDEGFAPTAHPAEPNCQT